MGPEEPRGQYEPVVHASTPDAPVSRWKLPAGAIVHALEPRASAKLPDDV